MDLRAKPFCLDDEGIAWVEKTRASLSQEDKLGQLFCLCAREGTEQEWTDILSVLRPGGIMYRPFPLETAVEYTKILSSSPVPMLIAANLEKGGNGIVSEGTLLGTPMEVAATDELDMARKLAEVAATEGAAVGANWAFSPIIDIDYNFQNPITNVRTFGSDPKRVRDMGEIFVKTVQSHGLAVSIKHFPGDGCDGRDQHLVTSVNSLDCDAWDETYGSIYKRCIDAGAMTVMVGHIMQPAYSRRLNPALRDEEILPATLAPELMQGLLRDKLGFNGLIVTDATTMAGFTIPMPRCDAVPASIAAGADMFLFTRNLADDVGYMRAGLERGILTPERLDEAVTRILALKAALGLHKQRQLPTLDSAKAVVGSAEHKLWAKECADKAVTLVKEEPGVLPISPAKYPRVLYYDLESGQGPAYSVRAGACEDFCQLLKNEGFDVEVFKPAEGFEGFMASMEDYLDKYDLIVYLANLATKSNQTTVRIEWAQPMGANCPHYVTSIPTIFISVENPYHLYDAPRVKTFINAYNSTMPVLEAIVDKLTGRSTFKGKSPVDAFCGQWDTKL